MKVTELKLSGLMLIEPRLFLDDRGFFFESFSQREFEAETGSQVDFVQDNHSRSLRGVLRGLHYQMPSSSQGKLVRVVRGSVWDVAVDIRKSSKTFGQWVGQLLTEENHLQMWIPPGFAHGFVTLSDSAEYLYKTTGYYDRSAERGIAWNDPDIGIEWPQLDIEFSLSEKDRNQPAFKQAELFD
ncbi:dTDP-4-dehydrorhamnose 3,5-epimerase [Comamonas testosteroni]|uniref:dTDP-4-dehydrorhamnose 3,5-epimerase n=1 Tax=Comamonas testosteroni TaxID=285 RepID=UPI0005B4DA47|nr:dTDP-4-dehydrorhamnose 3,5-epimerase [Comamonas testosteroni]